jgi:hypothetical protein
MSTTSQEGNRALFYCHPQFQGRIWHDWAYVHFEEMVGSGETIERYYPAKILGIITTNGETETVIQCSEWLLIWTELERKMFVNTVIGTDFNVSYVSVPLSALVHPLCVIPDNGGHNTQYIIVLPRRNWTSYFGDRIKTEYKTTL